MTFDHVAKVGSLIFPVKRVASDASMVFMTMLRLPSMNSAK